MSPLDATHLLSWDEESLLRHGVEPVQARLEKREDPEDDGVFWDLIASLRGKNGEAPNPVALEIRMFDSDGIEVYSTTEPLRRGIGRSAGLLTGNILAYTNEDEARRVADVAVVAHRGGPHPSDEPVAVPISLASEALLEVGIVVESTRGTCTTSRWSNEIEATVAVRASVDAYTHAQVWPHGIDPAVTVQVMAADGLPLTAVFDDGFCLVEDPDFHGIWVGAITIDVPEVPSRIILRPPSEVVIRRDPDDDDLDSGASIERTPAVKKVAVKKVAAKKVAAKKPDSRAAEADVTTLR